LQGFWDVDLLKKENKMKAIIVYDTHSFDMWEEMGRVKPSTSPKSLCTRRTQPYRVV
jgi:hypothetical protein